MQIVYSSFSFFFFFNFLEDKVSAAYADNLENKTSTQSQILECLGLSERDTSGTLCGEVVKGNLSIDEYRSCGPDFSLLPKKKEKKGDILESIYKHRRL